MGQEFRYWCPVETWRLLWLMGTLFAVIIAFQYFELPYGKVPSSLSFAHEAGEAGNGSISTEGMRPEPEIISTPSSGLNYSSPYGVVNTTSSDVKEKIADVNKDLVPEGMMGFNNSSQIDDYDIEASPEGWADKNINPSSSPVEKIDARPASVETDHPNLSPTLKPVNTSDAKPTLAETNHPNISLTLNPVNNSDASPSPERTDQNFSRKNATSPSEGIKILDAGNSSTVAALPPVYLSPNVAVSRNVESGIIAPVAPAVPDVAVVKKDTTPNMKNNGKSWELNKPQVITIPKAKEFPDKTMPAVLSVAEMKKLLLQSRSYPNSVRPRWPSPVDQELLSAKSQIMNAPIVKNDPLLYAPLYQNVSMFKRSYELMEDLLKVYIYKEGERPIFHQPLLQGIYASEGWFMKQMEANKKFVTKNPRKAHLFYLPFGSRNLEEKLYVVNSHSHKNLIEYLKNYVDMIAARHSFWNRTGGSDHFLVACHDWAASETRVHMAKCIRALCNADVKEGYVFGKDVSLPETYVRTPKNPLREVGGKPPSKRSILAFFAGSMHGYLRPILLQHWENKDPDMRIYGRLPRVKGQMSYIQYMKSSKYCICAKGYEVNSPRVVEAIMYECVPVIISDNFVPPFFEILDWESFAVFIPEKDIPNLKNILLSIPGKRYRSMQLRVKKVQQHFLWHSRPVKYDLFHMILHSIWYKRVFQMQS